MTRKRQIALVLEACLAVCAATGPVGADPLWKSLVPGARVEADPNQPYVMTDRNGPWMIMATTFSGEGAEDQATELVLELRRRYKLEAYLHEMTFDFSEGVTGRGVDRTGRPMKMKYQRDGQIREIAVLVGNYPSVDDPIAQKTLRKIKFMLPAALSSEHRDKTNQSLAALRTIQAALLPEGDERRKKGPMGHAFITRNPMLPEEYFVPQGLDKLVVEMNQGVKHSLLDCQGKYTVQVATFTGTVVLDQKKIQAHERGMEMKSRLEEAADKAHRLTIALRQSGYEAYEFHDRCLSMVTIGSFDSPGTPRIDGKIEINPKIHSVMRTFGAQPRSEAAMLTMDPRAQTAYQPRSLIGIPFDLQPQIVQVPQRSISSDYAR